MKWISSFIVRSLIAGVLIVVPLYLAILLLLKAMASVVGLVRPLAGLMPDWMPAENLLALGLVLLLCFLVGAVVRTRTGRAMRERVETSLFDRIPGYAVLRNLTLQLVGQGHESVWKPAFIEIEDALVPGFIIEELADGRLTVFVPSVPTPLAGAVYVLSAERVHPLDVPFTQAIKPISRWGSGCAELVAGIKT
jgi:uncharacterized membrane protein